MTTTTTTTPTTTTTTTTPAPLKEVITVFIDGESLEVVQQTSASDDVKTEDTPFSNSASFSTVAPGETSKTIITQLNIPNVKGITNIKLGLINIGELSFSSNSFGVANNYLLIKDYPIESYFQGVNTDKSASSAYNISIPNKDLNNSDYVYLNINVPRNSIPEPSIIRYRWFFDFAE
jgi:hypothetical protein